MWFIWALLSAVVSSISVILNKHVMKRVSALTLSLATFLFPIPILLLMSLSQNNSIIWSRYLVGTLGSGFGFVIAKTIMFETIKQTSLSKVYPLFSLTTFVTYFFGLIFLNEHIKLLGVVGITFTIIGAYLINVDSAKEDILMPFKLLFKNRTSILFLVSLLLSGLTSITDKIAIVSSNIPVAYLGGNIVSTTFLILYILIRKKQIKEEIQQDFVLLFVASIIYMILVLFVFYGFASGPVALVSGVKKLELLFVLILSWIFFKDKPSKHSFTASICMLLGIICMKI